MRARASHFCAARVGDASRPRGLWTKTITSRACGGGPDRAGDHRTRLLRNRARSARLFSSAFFRLFRAQACVGRFQGASRPSALRLLHARARGSKFGANQNRIGALCGAAPPKSPPAKPCAAALRGRADGARKRLLCGGARRFDRRRKSLSARFLLSKK